MTVLAWDGKTLAADKRAVSNGLILTVTKIFRVECGLIGISGNYDVGFELIEWLKNGGNPREYPEVQKDDERYAHLLLITPQREILRYERQPYPCKYEEPFFAAGCGRDYAMAAMHCGKSAREAVEIASRFDNGCGNGVDELRFES